MCTYLGVAWWVMPKKLLMLEGDSCMLWSVKTYYYYNGTASIMDSIGEITKIKLILGTSFASKNSFHEDIAKANAVSMIRIHKLYLTAVSICGVLFTSYPLINRSLGQEAHLFGYFPFDTSEAPM